MESAAPKRPPLRAACARNDAARAPWAAQGCGPAGGSGSGGGGSSGPSARLRAACQQLRPPGPPARPARLQLPVPGRFLRLRTAPAMSVLKRQRAPPGSSSPRARGGGWGGPWEGAGGRERGIQPRAARAAAPAPPPPALPPSFPLRRARPSAATFPPPPRPPLPTPWASPRLSPTSFPGDTPRSPSAAQKKRIWPGSPAWPVPTSAPDAYKAASALADEPHSGRGDRSPLSPKPGRGQSPRPAPVAPSGVLVGGPVAPPSPASPPRTCARLSPRRVQPETPKSQSGPVAFGGHLPPFLPLQQVGQTVLDQA
ncbi:basic proline-rich protein-like [Suncus etruscus]|uniref:basic proline-rich protein-like n=1 Tax=Suncus etruscus TaxID=109475 RepID=UPI00210FE35F|nr:basic proline-rich protein-like [Suncus etruscus]